MRFIRLEVERKNVRLCIDVREYHSIIRFIAQILKTDLERIVELSSLSSALKADVCIYMD